MARVAILVMLPVVALLVWRDVVLERQIAGLVAADALYDVQTRAFLAARDATVDDATWELLNGEPDRAIVRIRQAAAMPSPTGMPERAWLIGAGAGCLTNQREYAGWRRDPRVARFCQRAAASR